MDACTILIKSHVYDVLAYTDNSLIMWQASNRRGIERTDHTVSNLLDKWCEENKMTVAPTKSEVMIFTRTGSPRLKREPMIEIVYKIVPVVR